MKKLKVYQEADNLQILITFPSKIDFEVDCLKSYEKLITRITRNIEEKYSEKYGIVLKGTETWKSSFSVMLKQSDKKILGDNLTLSKLC